MKSVIFRAAIGLVGLVVAWIFGTRPLARFLDRFFTVRVASLPVHPIVRDSSGGMKIGDLWLSIPSADFITDETEIALTKERSYLSWPNPFEMNFMTGWTASKKRYTYYRLIAKKPSGERLEMVWRFEEYYYSQGGWAGADMTNGDSTGLIRVRRSVQN